MTDDAAATLDPDSRAWIDALEGNGPEREAALERLHGLLLRAARFQLARRAPGSAAQLRGEPIDDIALEAANDALVSILARLRDFRGASHFTTWAYKFAIFESSVALRKRNWKGRELPVEEEHWSSLNLEAAGPAEELEQIELLRTLRSAVFDTLTKRQREVFVAIVLNDAPIDVVAARLGTTRGAVYKTLHDARRKLRAQYDQDGDRTPPTLAAPAAAERPPPPH